MAGALHGEPWQRRPGGADSRGSGAGAAMRRRGSARRAMQVEARRRRAPVGGPGRTSVSPRRAQRLSDEIS
jgi:hypothetical protein